MNSHSRRSTNLKKFNTWTKLSIQRDNFNQDAFFITQLLKLNTDHEYTEKDYLANERILNRAIDLVYHRHQGKCIECDTEKRQNVDITNGNKRTHKLVLDQHWTTPDRVVSKELFATANISNEASRTGTSRKFPDEKYEVYRPVM